jgi:MFS family permease
MSLKKSNFRTNETLLLICFYFVLTLITINQYLIVPNYEVVRKEFGINQILVGLISTSYLFAITISVLFWGYYTDKLNRIKLLVFGMIISIFFLIMIYFSNNYWQLIIFMIGIAVGNGACYPIGFSIINDLTKPEKRSTTFAWWSIVIGIGSGLGVIIGGIVVNWRVPFLYMIIPNAVLIIILLFLKEPQRGGKEFAVDSSTDLSYYAYSYKIERSDIKKLLKKKSVLYLILQGFLSAIPIGIVSFWVIALYIREYNMSKDTASFSSIIIFLGMLFGSYIFGIIGDKKFIKDRQARVKICIWTTILSIPLWILVFLFPFETSPNVTLLQLFLIPLAIFMFIMGIIASTVNEGGYPNKFSILGDITLPEHRGTAMGMYNFSANLGIGISPLIGGILAYIFGYSLRIAIMIGFFFWIPVIILFVFIKKSIENDIQEISDTLKTRQNELS